MKWKIQCMYVCILVCVYTVHTHYIMKSTLHPQWPLHLNDCDMCALTHIHTRNEAVVGNVTLCIEMRLKMVKMEMFKEFSNKDKNWMPIRNYYILKKKETKWISHSHTQLMWKYSAKEWRTCACVHMREKKS